ncbi:MAG: hypothetical protein QOG78_4637, partial [Rhodospirillaceae bacterium]|nr:hypothetical protein [Rhodospirillaceae bacterium]
MQGLRRPSSNALHLVAPSQASR